ncbi:MAG: hypothetical protein AAFX40_19545, partial [Cyanobacteria bacterium J06639_1]
MHSLKNPRDRFLRHAALLLLAFSVFASVFATVLHALEPDSLAMDTILPPLNGALQLCLLVYLYHNPDRLVPVVWTSGMSIIAITCIPVWYSIVRAISTADVTLVEILPPMSSVPVVTVAIA